ncbi:putative spermidine/putrescine transport system permease protein [Bosea lupini]|uniref:Putative spermidine/putrescine transport system permease protein n=1 Tax=Bosea lupini TaxID=1036779 RepID=A0A1H7TXJ3_9HYPH|nr:ABC transporter permease [Bosea lupini]SEL89146.1 putative spermidine/putrescine transport system permease protein [Bosea lupini]
MQIRTTNAHVRDAAYAMPAALFMALLFALPLFSVLHQSLQQENGGGLTIQAYAKIFTTPLFLRVAYTTLEVSISATVFSLLLAYPIAYFLAKQSPRRRALYMILVLVPFWTSSLVKSFSFMVLLGQSGIINQMLGAFGIAPVKMLFNRFGVMVGMSHFLIPFFVFPILTSLRSQPLELAKAAAIMGAGKLRIFLRVTLPLSLPGVMAGALLVFILSLGFYIIPALLGGRQDMMFANLVDFYTREALNWPMASAVAVLLVAAAALAAMLLSKVRGGSSILSEEGH